jgi:hypothetical protein
MRKTTCLAALICLNLILLTALVFAGTTPRVAAAQSGDASDNYLVVAGEIQEHFDALYVLDVRERMLHTFYFRKGTRDLDYGGYRHLEQDFRHNKE